MNTPAEIAELYIMVGDGKTSRKSWVLFVLACFAGAFIALGGLTSQIVSCGVTPAGLGRFLSGVVFPVGLVMVVIASGELFTGNCLIFISVLSKNTYMTAMLRTWLFVYLGNMVGGAFIAAMANYGHVFDLYGGKLAELAVNTATAKVSMTFIDGMIKGILCNFLVCVAIWMSFATEEINGKIPVLYLPVAIFVICGFEHSVANMYFIPAGLIAKYVYNLPAEGLTLLNYFWKNLLPVTVGNIIGGSIIVGAGYWLVFLRPQDED
ncbi:MAG: formate/nitrite transporter family protein [Treponema sp.]|nr:formate/nitrite transporter family protein [Treponema sp.]